MDANLIVNKVMSKLQVKLAQAPFTSKSVSLGGFHSFLEERLLDKLKKEWKIDKIDTKELDWDWGEISLDWYANFPRSSGVLNIQLVVPDQKIKVEGTVTYIDDEDKEHGPFDFNESFEINDIKADYKDVTINSDIAVNELEYYSNKFTAKF